MKIEKLAVLMDDEYAPSNLAGSHLLHELKKLGFVAEKLSLRDVFLPTGAYDTMFNVYYGEMGDGGCIAAALELQGKKFIGNNSRTCSLMWNKVASKLIFQNLGLDTPNYWFAPSREKSSHDFFQEVNRLTYPLIAKPVSGAASEHSRFIENAAQLETFIQIDLHSLQDGVMFIEEFIRGTEMSCGKITSIQDALPVVEIRLKEGVLYQDNRVKFTPGLKDNIIPAAVDSGVYQEVQRVAKRLHEFYRASFFSRTDFIYDASSKKIQVLEINANPGLLETSLLPLMAKHAGMDYADFIHALIAESLV